MIFLNENIGCTYVLHSSGQLYSHKRKHERRDTELAYRKFKLAQSMMKTLSEAGGMHQAFLPEPVSFDLHFIIYSYL